MKILVESAIKLDADEMKSIEKTLSSKVENPAFEYKVNPSILGGLRVTMGGKRIDLSLSGRVQTISANLS